MSITQDLLNHLLKKEPLPKKVKKIFDFLFDLIVIFPYYKIFRSAAFFKFQGRSYKYFLSPYNFTWENERIIEVPIILDLVKESRGKKILEVGNVLSRYFSINHNIVDKYEGGDGVINRDIIDFQPPCKYDLIVSISTFEHIGFDESPNKNANSVLDAFRNVKNLLAPGGKAVVTLPLGYNPELDNLIKEGKIQFSEKYCMKRVSRLNSWIEVNWDAVSDPTYDKPFRFCNWLLIGVIKDQSVKG